MTGLSMGRDERQVRITVQLLRRRLLHTKYNRIDQEMKSRGYCSERDEKSPLTPYIAKSTAISEIFRRRISESSSRLCSSLLRPFEILPPSRPEAEAFDPADLGVAAGCEVTGRRGVFSELTLFISFRACPVAFCWRVMKSNSLERHPLQTAMPNLGTCRWLPLRL